MLYKFCFSVFLILLLLLSSQAAKPRIDFDGDGISDPGVVGFEITGEFTNQMYWYVPVGTFDYTVTQFGANDGNAGGYNDFGVPADYDGDGKTDIAVWRRPREQGVQAYFHILYSRTGTYEVIPWGISDHVSFPFTFETPVPADYDGDGKADIAVTRSQGDGLFWWIRLSTGGISVQRWGQGDYPAPADYDGDGKTDLAVYRAVGPQGNTAYTWYILKSSDGNWIVKQLGSSTNASQDYPAIGDYDGDGKADICVVATDGDFATWDWKWITSSDGVYHVLHWGQALADTVAQGDYDGDGKTDIAIYRKSLNCSDTSRYWINGSRNGLFLIPFGGCRNRPIAPRF
jgi:hypothetical protein